MSKSDTFEADILDLIFLGTAIPNLADNASAAPLGNLYVSLHTADPGEGGDQSSNEAAYSTYARVAVPRNGTGWTRTGNQIKPAADIVFPKETASGGETLTHFGIGVAASGATKLLYSGTISPSVVMANKTQPVVDTDTVITED